MGEVEGFREKRIEYYTLLVASILYPTLLLFGTTQFLWSWGLKVFSSSVRIAILANLIFLFIILFPILKLFVNAIKYYRPGNKFLKLRGVDLKKLKKVVIEVLNESDIKYKDKMNKKPEHSFSEVLYRKEIFTVKLDSDAFIRIKKNRHFTEDTDVSKKVWDLQYDGTRAENGKDDKLLRNLSQMLKSYVID